MVAFDHACSCDQEYGKVYVIGQQHLAINDLQIRYQNRVASSKQHTFLRHCWCLKGLKVSVSFIVPRRFFSCLGLTIMILTLMCQPEAHWFFVTKDSFVWLVTNLINKPNVSKQWFLLYVLLWFIFFVVVFVLGMVGRKWSCHSTERSCSASFQQILEFQ